MFAQSAVRRDRLLHGACPCALFGAPVGAAPAASFSSHPPPPIAFNPSRLAPLLQGETRVGFAVGAAPAASFSSHPPAPVAFNPSRLAPLLQRETRLGFAVGAAPAASFSSHPPTPVAFNPSRLAPLLQRGDALWVCRRSGASRELLVCRPRLARSRAVWPRIDAYVNVTLSFPPAQAAAGTARVTRPTTIRRRGRRWRGRRSRVRRRCGRWAGRSWSAAHRRCRAGWRP